MTPRATPLVIVGAGGFGLEVAAYAEDATRAGTSFFAPRGFLDDTRPAGALHAGLPVLGSTDAAPEPDALYLLAVGAPEARRALALKLARKGARFATLLHPLAWKASSARVEEGVIAAPFAFIGPETCLGAHTLLNIYASVGHEAETGRFCALAPYAGLHGGATLGEAVFMGAHACVTAGARVGDGARLAAGAVLYNDLPDNAQALGNPAAQRPLRRA